jgi:hypothetical protein
VNAPAALPEPGTDASVRSALQDAVAASQALLEAARAGAWQRAEQLCVERDARVREALSPANPGYPESVTVQDLLRLSALDRDILDAVGAERGTLRARLDHTRGARRARHAYARAAT